MLQVVVALPAMSNDFDIIENTVGNSKAKGPGAVPAFRKRETGFSRQDVVNAFANAFEMIGGTTRLALWANANPDKFFPLMTKLFPSTAIAIGAPARPVIEHAIGPTPLDNHPGYAPPTLVVLEEEPPAPPPDQQAEGD